MSTNPDFEAFFSQHHGPVVRSLTMALADRSRAEDAAQDAFAKAYRQWRRVSMMERPVAWVYVVALNGARKNLKRELMAPAPDLLGAVRDPAGPVAVRLSVQDALAELAPRQRLAIVLRYLADLQVADVAAAMGCTVGTAKATLHTALARMRVELAPAELEDMERDDAARVSLESLVRLEPLAPVPGVPRPSGSRPVSPISGAPLNFMPAPSALAPAASPPV